MATTDEDKKFDETARGLFKKYDLDSNGSIDGAEAILLMRDVYGTKGNKNIKRMSEKTNILMKKWDTDKDGKAVQTLSSNACS